MNWEKKLATLLLSVPFSALVKTYFKKFFSIYVFKNHEHQKYLFPSRRLPQKTSTRKLASTFSPQILLPFPNYLRKIITEIHKIFEIKIEKLCAGESEFCSSLQRLHNHHLIIKLCNKNHQPLYPSNHLNQ